MKILVLLPTKPTLCLTLRQRAMELTARLPDANPDHEFTIIHDYRIVAGLPDDKTPWARVTRARQTLLDSIGVARFDYVLWIDADVVEYPADLPSRLILANPKGIAAPMVFIEGQEGRLYDWAAFVIEGMGHIEPQINRPLKGRNLMHDAPYWPKEPETQIVPMDCVGTILNIHSSIMVGHHFYDRASATDWFTLCAMAKRMYGSGAVVVDRGCIALHADLGSGKYEGELWH